MKRDIDIALQTWKTSTRRKPLVIHGARQVGKTYAMKQFGTTYSDMLYLNFEKDEKLHRYFEETLDPKQLIQMLGLHVAQRVTPETLLIFDEIQECPKALNSLKYFCEEAANYHIVAAGSLLGITTAREKGFPVGKVNFLHLYPMTFFEFLSATGHEDLRAFLMGYEGYVSLPLALHEKLLRLLKHYFFIGGMPEAVARYASTEDLHEVREIQNEILDAYERDFAKHVPAHDLMKVTSVWKQIHQQLAKENKKFTFSDIQKNARSRAYTEAIEWLINAGLVYRSYLVQHPKLPLRSMADPTAFKLFLCDVGLLGAQCRLGAQTIIEGNALFGTFKGALTENYVAQTLTAAGHDLYYWTSKGTAEVDFLFGDETLIFPLEVKAGPSEKKKSLRVYADANQPPYCIRSNTLNLKKDGLILNCPLYYLMALL